MAQQAINVGTIANDGTGDSIRAAFQKVNANDTELYSGAHIHAATSKTTPVDADELPLIDSAASNVLKKLTWANLKATLKSYFDALYLAIPGAWTSSSVTVTASSGSFTAISATRRISISGTVVKFQVAIDITTNGTAGGAIIVPMPANAVATFTASGREELATGTQVMGQISVGTNELRIVSNTNGYAGGDGYRINISGQYEKAP